MNLVGRVFVLLILALSLTFLGFAASVLATHKDWKSIILREGDGLKQQVAVLAARADNLSKQRDALQAQLNLEQVDKARRLGDLERRNVSLRGERQQFETERDQILTETRQNVALLKTAQAELAKRLAQADKLRAEIDTARQNRDDNLEKVIQLTDEMLQVENEVKRLQDINQRLARQLADAKLALAEEELTIDTPIEASSPEVDGIVTAVDDKEGYVEISLGKSAGLSVGQKLQIFRRSVDRSSWLGTVELTRVTTDRSVGRIIPETLQKPIQRDDRVASRLN